MIWFSVTKMFCGSITESLPTQVPHLPQCSYGLPQTMKTYEKQKIVTNYACYCSTTMLTSKIIKETKKFVSIRSWSIIKFTMMLLWKRHFCLRRPSFVGLGGRFPVLWHPCLPLSAVTVSLHYLPRCLSSAVTWGKTPNIVTWSEH